MSGWIQAKFVYNGNTFIPTYPPKGKVPIDGQHADRVDSITTSGLQQSILKKVDRVLTLDFPIIPVADLAAWDAFITWAIGGNQFQYYPDSTSGANNFYYMVDTDIGAKWVAIDTYTVSLSLRRVLTAEIGS